MVKLNGECYTSWKMGVGCVNDMICDVETRVDMIYVMLLEV